MSARTPSSARRRGGAHARPSRAPHVLSQTAVVVSLGLGTAALDSSPAAAAGSTNSLSAGASLAPSQAATLTSPDRQHRLVAQSDGNVVLYGPGDQVVWNTGTGGGSDRRLVLQDDGNLVVYRSGGQALWATNRYGAGSRLVLQDDGNLVVYRGDGSVSWASGTVADRLLGRHSATLSAQQQQAMTSRNHAYQARMQDDGNLVVYRGTQPVWATGSMGSAGSRTVMQPDGNLVVYDAQNRAQWSSRTGGADSQVVLQDDGNLVVTAGGRTAWSSYTGLISPGYGPGPNQVLCRSSDFSCDKTGYGAVAHQSHWGAYAGHNCTNYAAFRQASRGVAQPSARMGNGSDWARNSGGRANQTPAVNATAQWNGGAPGMSSAGHVAHVVEVGPGYIVVTEDSYSSKVMSTRRINAGTSGWPSNFIHF